MQLQTLTPEEKIQKAKVRVSMEKPFFGHLILHLNYIEKENIPTMCVDPKGNMYYNPEFVEEQDLETMKALVVHEILHVGLEHFKRAGSRNERIANYAMDLVINDMLVQNGFKLPDDTLKPNRQHEYTFDELGITISNINEKSFEQVHEELENKLPDNEIEIAMKSQQGDDEDDDQQGQGQGQGIPVPQDEDSDSESGESQSGDSSSMEGPSGPSSSSSSGGEEDDDSDDTGSDSAPGEDDEEDSEEESGSGTEEQDSGDEEDEGSGSGDIEDQSDLPERMDQHYYEDPTEDDEQGSDMDDKVKEQKDFEKIMNKAMQKSQRRGEMPAGIERRLDELSKAQVDWRTVLQTYITNMLPYDYTWERPNKKYRHMGIYLPSVEKETLEVCVAIDTSGSIGQRELQNFVSEVSGMIKGFDNVNLTIIQHDAAVQEVDEVSNRHDLDDVTFSGGGGTSHVPVYKWIDENKSNAELVVNFTDGYTDYPKKQQIPHSLDTIWILDNHNVDAERFDYGKIIRNVPEDQER